ncbi:MAG TPA: hypothetical protein VIY48_09415 [Candidatus Paceibacterota bacterium]|jgi:hypothetical protein
MSEVQIDRVAVNQLLRALESFAPDNEARAVCIKMYHDAIKDGADDKRLCTLLAGWILDGLRYGNWPWIVTPPSGSIPYRVKGGRTEI